MKIVVNPAVSEGQGSYWLAKQLLMQLLTVWTLSIALLFI
jgi:hypothetical protein